MMEEWAGDHVIESFHSRSHLDMAKGVLIGLRRCDTKAAFDELLGAAKRHGVGLTAMASAVVDLACGQSPADSAASAYFAASCEWAGLFDKADRGAAGDIAGNSASRQHGGDRLWQQRAI